jgi:O-antigen ligase
MLNKYILSTNIPFLSIITFLFGFSIPLKEDYSSKMLLVVFVLGLIYIHRNRKGLFIEENFKKLKTYILLFNSLILLYALCNTLLNGMDENFDANRFSFSILLFVFSLFFVFLRKVKINFRLFVFSLFIGLSLSGIIRVVFWLFVSTGSLPQRINIPYDDYISSNPIVYAVMLNFCYSYFLFLLKEKQLDIINFCFIFLVILFFQLTYFSFSGFFIFLLTNVCFLIYINFKRTYRVFTLILFSLSLISFSFLLTKTGSDFLTKIEGESSRVRNYATSIYTIKKAPIIGYGIGNELTTLQSNRDASLWEHKNKYHAHNQYFEILIGGGFLYLFLYLLNFLAVVSHAIMRDKIVLVLFLINITFTMYIESLLVIHKGFIFVSLILSYLIFFNDNKQDLYSSK